MGTEKIVYSKIELIEMSNCILIKKEVDESQNAKAYRIYWNNKRSTKICCILSVEGDCETISLLLSLCSIPGAHTILIEYPNIFDLATNYVNVFQSRISRTVMCV